MNSRRYSEKSHDSNVYSWASNTVDSPSDDESIHRARGAADSGAEFEEQDA
jgi:hypothetical protein